MKTDLKNTTMELQEMDSQGLRRSGRTTRLADSYIQELFDKGTITVADHFTHSENGRPFPNASRNLFDVVSTRMEREHKGDFYNLVLDVRNLTITLKR